MRDDHINPNVIGRIFVVNGVERDGIPSRAKWYTFMLAGRYTVEPATVPSRSIPSRSKIFCSGSDTVQTRKSHVR